MIEFFKRNKYWAGEDYKGDTVWGTGDTPEAARLNLEKVIASLEAEESDPTDFIQEWIEVNTPGSVILNKYKKYKLSDVLPEPLKPGDLDIPGAPEPSYDEYTKPGG